MYDGNRFIHHRHSDTDPASLADDRVWKIFEDSKRRLWIGTLEQGVDLFNREENRFIHFKQGAPNSVHSSYVSSIIEDRNQNIWFATAFGLDVLDARTGVFNHFEHSENDKTSLSQNNLIDLIEDSRGLIWVGSRDGLNVYDPVKKQFKVFRTDDGLPDNTIVALLEDTKQNIWVSTPQGLSKLTVSFAKESRELSIRCINYDENDGLQGREFNERASLKTKEGELAFAGPNGNPDIILAGDEYQAEVMTGRYDASYGLLLKGDGKGNFIPVPPVASGLVIDGDVKDMKLVTTAGKAKVLLVGVNDTV